VALVPDAVFYLRVGIDDLITRVIFSRGFDYWESGMDVFPGSDMFENFRNYQTALLHEFDRLSAEYKFDTVDASIDATAVFAELKIKILNVLEGDSRKSYLAKLYDRAALNPTPRFEPAVRGLEPALIAPLPDAATTDGPPFYSPAATRSLPSGDASETMRTLLSSVLHRSAR
jgi:hypothetical protein